MYPEECSAARRMRGTGKELCVVLAVCVVLAMSDDGSALVGQS
jgi:hypothetical protein